MHSHTAPQLPKANNEDNQASRPTMHEAQHRPAERLSSALASRHKFHEPKLLSLVLVHFGSMKHESGLEDAEDAQGSQLALMWIGDAILQFLITEQLIARYATPNNFRLHTARVHLVNRKSCGM